MPKFVRFDRTGTGLKAEQAMSFAVGQESMTLLANDAKAAAPVAMHGGLVFRKYHERYAAGVLPGKSLLQQFLDKQPADAATP